LLGAQAIYLTQPLLRTFSTEEQRAAHELTRRARAGTILRRIFTGGTFA
jgi:hypothetical protein